MLLLNQVMKFIKTLLATEINQTAYLDSLATYCIANFTFYTLSPNSRSNANFSFQFTASYVWYSMENLACDLLLGLKFVKLPILPTLFIYFVQGRLWELKDQQVEQVDEHWHVVLKAYNKWLNPLARPWRAFPNEEQWPRATQIIDVKCSNFQAVWKCDWWQIKCESHCWGKLSYLGG